MIKAISSIVVVLFTSLLIYGSTAYTDNSSQKLTTNIRVNETKIKNVEATLSNLDTKVDRILNILIERGR